MDFAGVNYLAVIVAAIAGFAIGALWYSFLFAKLWMEAIGITEAEIRERRSAMPFVIAIIAYVIMAWALAVLIGSVFADAVTFGDGILAGALAWLGFVVTTTAVNYSFAGRKPSLTAIDSGHWLVALLVQGAIVAAFG
jgi:hypothetical protein